MSHLGSMSKEKSKGPKHHGDKNVMEISHLGSLSKEKTMSKLGTSLRSNSWHHQPQKCERA